MERDHDTQAPGSTSDAGDPGGHSRLGGRDPFGNDLPRSGDLALPAPVTSTGLSDGLTRLLARP